MIYSLMEFSSIDAIQFVAKIILISAAALSTCLVLAKIQGVKASFRHCLLTLAMLTMWCVGIWSALLPTYSVAVIPVLTATASTGDESVADTRVSTTNSFATTPSFSNSQLPASPPLSTEPRVTPEPHDLGQASGAPITTPANSSWKMISFTWQAQLISLWIVGTALLLVRLAIGIFSLKQSIFRWSATEDQLLVSTLKTQTDSAKRILSFAGPIRYCVGPKDQMPFAFGLLQPVVCLPNNFGEWTETEQRSVIFHEVSHIARRDTVSDLIAETTKAIFWWNPLVWAMCRQHETERELACDEQVLKTDQPADQYASDLVSIVRRASSRIGLGATPIARKSQLDGRVRNILLAENRTRARMITYWIAVVSFVVLSVPIIGLSASTYNFNQDNASTAKIKSDDIGIKKAELTDKQLEEIAKKRASLIETNGPPEAPIISTHGLILDHTGLPLEGAEVSLQVSPFYHADDLYFQGYRKSRSLFEKVNSVLAKVITDKSGTFRFEKIQAPEYFLNRDFPRYRLIVRAPGKGLEWNVLRSPIDVKAKHITLHPEAIAKGTVVSKDGKPIANAKVSATSFALLEPDVDGKFGDHRIIDNYTENEIDVSTTTGDDGKFALMGLPDGKRVVLTVTKPGFVSGRRMMAVGNFDPAIIPRIEKSVYVEKVESGDQEFVLERARSIKGKIVYEDTGLPVANCRFKIRGQLNPLRLDETNDKGEFESGPLRDTNSVMHLIPYRKPGYVRSFEVFEFAEKEFEKKDVVIKLKRGEKISGIVKNELGEPVEGAKMYYLPDGPIPIKHHIDAVYGPKTKADGRFEMFVPLGSGSLHVVGFPRNAVVPTRSDAWRSRAPDAGGLVKPHKRLIVDGMSKPDIEIIAQTGIRLGGTVMLPDGTAAVGAKLEYLSDEEGLGQTPEARRDIDTTTGAKGGFKLQAIPRPEKGKHSNFIHIFHSALFKATSKDGKYATYVDVEKFDRQNNVEIRLRPVATLSGSVILDGKPVVGVRVRVRTAFTDLQNFLPEVRTDEFGKFTFPNLPTGFRYKVSSNNGDEIGFKDDSIVLEKDSTLNPLSFETSRHK